MEHAWLVQDVPVTSTPTDQSRWWLKPAIISIASIVLGLGFVTFLDGWSLPVVAVVLVGFACGTWWFLEQRPRA